MHSCFFKLEGRLKAGQWKVLYLFLQNKKGNVEKAGPRPFGVSAIFVHRAVHVFHEDHSTVVVVIVINRDFFD
jgi:hypothetical protein